MSKITVVVITYNEGKNIARCLASVKPFVDEVVVVDSGSTDDTIAIAAQLGAKVVHQPFLGYGKQKQFAVNQATNNFVFSIDADEQVSNDLQQAILGVKDSSNPKGAYYVKRLNSFCGKWMLHGGDPNTLIRLFDRRVAGFNENEVHENIVLKQQTTTAVLEGNLLHYAFDSVADHTQKIEKYTAISAPQLAQKSSLHLWLKMTFSPILRFINTYLLKAGILDGAEGLQLALCKSRETRMKYHKALIYKRG